MKVLRITLSLEYNERGGLPILLGGVTISQGMSVRQIQDTMRESATFVTQYLHDHEALCVKLEDDDLYVHEAP